jgi:type IV pilus assembly protein PilQ
MKGPTKKRVYCGALVSIIIFLVIGCASQQKMGLMPSTISQNLVKKIAVEESAEGKKVIIEGETALPYTFSRLIPQPLKLVVDIPQTQLAPEAATPITVGDGIIQEITAIQRNGDIEVSISLNKLVKYQVQKEGNLLVVEVGKLSPLLAEEEKEEIKIVQESRPPVKEEAVKKALPPAKNLVDVFADTSHKDRIILQLKADGTVGDYNAFDLQKPTRLVIDLWKIKRKFGKKTVAINSPYLKMVRLGDYPQKVRVVLDIPLKTLPSHRLDRMGNRLIIVIGKKDAVAEAVPPELKKEVAKEKEEITKEEAKISPALPITGEVTGIDFKQLEDKSRIIISTSTKAPYHVEEGPDNTVLVEVQGMTAPPKVRRPLDTHEFTSPILMITPINVVVGTKKGTQVVVKLRKMVAYEAKQENDRIYIDFDRTEEFKGEKPKPTEVVTVKKPPAEGVVEGPVEEVKKEETAKKEIALPPPPKAAPPVPAPGEETKEKVYTGKKITLDFKDADIGNILRLFAEVSDLNIIATGDVKGTVTIRLVDVPWDQAFDIVLQANNLGAERIGNVVRIVPLERLSAEKKIRSEAAKATEELEPLITEVIPISYGSAKEIGEQGIKPILSGRGKVVVDERTNTLIVTDIRSNVEKAKLLVRTLDAQTPQVLIQAKVIEANLDFSRELGIQWGGSFDGSITGGTVTGTGGVSDAAGDWAVNLPATVGSGAGGAIEFAIANLANTKYLQARISALEEKGQGRVISSPRVTTLDNTEASIEQGLRIPYLKLSEEGTATTDFIEANLKLTVTPHVTADGYIRMELDVKKDTPDESITVLGVPSIDKKEVKTEVLVKDGEVVVIGGIYTYTKTGSIDAVPLFYKIPLLGWLFQKKTKDDNKRELLIFIAPNIVQPRRIATP